MSRRRRSITRKVPTLPPLAMLDLSKPGERQAHEFLLRTTKKRDQMWTILNLRRNDDVLLCVVRWAHPERKAKPFSLAEVSLTEMAVCWRDYATIEEARAQMEERCTAAVIRKEEA